MKIEKVANFRKKKKTIYVKSFDTIAGSGRYYYRSNKISNRDLRINDLLLIDSGGQYKWGTTDVTRTICFQRVR